MAKMKSFTYRGWQTFSGTGDIFREWRLGEDVPELSATKGDDVLDIGPRSEPERRFRITRWDGTEWKTLGRYSLEEVEKALGYELPAWKPPREADIVMTEAIQSVASALGQVTKAIERASTDRERLDAIKRVVDSTRMPADPPPTKENRYLRLKGEHQYDNGDPYTNWELLVDVPEIRVTRVNDVKPMHAIKGDVLREGQDDELTPFELRRDGKRIADPEWWQVRHLFAGLRGNSDSEEEEDKVVDDIIDAFLALGTGTLDEIAHIFHATENVPETPVQAGDYLVYIHYARDRADPTASRAHVTQVPRAQLGTIGEHFDTLKPISIFPHPTGGRLGALSRVRRYLGRAQRPSWRDDTSPLFVLRPMVSPVVEPIQARSDDAAIFELLCQVGGRMPEGASNG